MKYLQGASELVSRLSFPLALSCLQAFSQRWLEQTLTRHATMSLEIRANNTVNTVNKCY